MRTPIFIKYPNLQIMNSETTNQFLSEVSQINKKFEEELDKDGSRFNIFSILNLTSNEVRLHTRFIGELLNTKGTHTYDKSFLDSFVKILKANITSNNTLNLFNVEKARVEIEKSTGRIDENYEHGGQIDLILSDQTLTNNQIIIENKIFASDQRNQLLRYHNYNSNALLLYLTLDGSKPREWSTNNNELIEGVHYHCVSYKELIVDWLEDCIKISKLKPKVSETLSQYLHIVHIYTNQSKRNKMTSDITKLIASNKDYFLAIPEIIDSYNLIKKEVIEKIWQSIREKQPKSKVAFTIDSTSCIHYTVDQDNEGFYYGFALVKEGVKQELNQKALEPLLNKCRQINSKFKNSGWWVWALSKYLFKLDSLPPERIFELNNATKMNEFTDLIIDELNYYISEIKKSYENDLEIKLN